eukprot:6450460-Lingulodinium_polyedra.AAC.1
MKERKMKLEKEGNAEEAGKVNLAGMGPPHMQVWAALVHAAATHCKEESHKKVLEEYWNIK